jgi:hypothetical protein
MSRLHRPSFSIHLLTLLRQNSAATMSEKNHPSGSEGLSDDTERSSGSPETPALQAAAPGELSQKDEGHLTSENIVDFDGDDDPANPLNCKSCLKIPSIPLSSFWSTKGGMKVLMLNSRVSAVQMEYHSKWYSLCSESSLMTPSLSYQWSKLACKFLAKWISLGLDTDVVSLGFSQPGLLLQLLPRSSKTSIPTMNCIGIYLYLSGNLER